MVKFMDSKQEKYPKIAVILLNWNTWQDTIECLESLYQVNYPNYEVIVVDNNSLDNSIEKIKEYAQGLVEINSKFVNYTSDNKPILTVEYLREEAERGDRAENEEETAKVSSNRKLVLIKNEKNYGFSGGNNIGIRYALHNKKVKYILLLNNDTVVDPNFLIELVDVMEKESKIGIAGSKIYDYYDNKLIQCKGGYICWWKGKIEEYDFWVREKQECDQISERDFVWATSALIKREVFEKIGLLDPYFFFGIEEYDFCTRAKKAGFKIVYVPTSKVWHKKGASSNKLKKYPDVKDMISKQRGILHYKHYHRLFKKHLPPILYFFPFSIFMIRKVSVLLRPGIRYLIRGKFKKIKTGLESLK